MPVTLKDIAEQTGVSPSVVSTVLSGRDNGTFVSESTRQKVLQVAESLHYTPVRAGRPRGSRRLRRLREERFIGVWAGAWTPGTAFLLQTLQAALAAQAPENGLEEGDDFGLRLLSDADLPRLDAIGLMGLILLTPVPLPREAAVATIPGACLGEMDNPPRDLVQVHLDNFDAGRQMAAHLWELGHRHVVLLAPGAQARTGRLRWQGMQAVWAERGGDPTWVLTAAYDMVRTLPVREQVQRTTLGLFGPETPLSSLPTALVCADETVAALVAQTLADMGRRVPEDVSLAALGDTPSLADALTPPLTVVRPPLAEMAEEAVARLFLLHDALLDGGTLSPDAELWDAALPGELVVRESTAPPPGSS